MARLGNISIDTDDSIDLQNFYANLFGWQKLTAFGANAVKTEDGTLILFNEIEPLEKAVWPMEIGKPQRQMHLDIQVKDVKAMVEKALALGATIAVCPDERMTDFVTMQDISGHPFCLCNADNPQ